MNPQVFQILNARVPNIGSSDFVKRLNEKAEAEVMFRTAFSVKARKTYLNFCANSTENISEAMNKVQRVFQKS